MKWFIGRHVPFPDSATECTMPGACDQVSRPRLKRRMKMRRLARPPPAMLHRSCKRSGAGEEGRVPRCEGRAHERVMPADAGGGQVPFPRVRMRDLTPFGRGQTPRRARRVSDPRWMPVCTGMTRAGIHLLQQPWIPTSVGMTRRAWDTEGWQTRAILAKVGQAKQALVQSRTA